MDVAPADRKVSEALREIADELEKRIEQVSGAKLGFSLVVFNSAPGSRLNYISNCNRSDVIAVYQTLQAGWGAGMPDIPAHETN